MPIKKLIVSSMMVAGLLAGSAPLMAAPQLALPDFTQLVEDQGQGGGEHPYRTDRARSGA